ncbi:MAG: DNA-processing protein DprA [Cyanobacteria bacterium J06581_3]
MATERAYWLAWSKIKHVGPVTIKRLWEHFGSLAIAWQANAGDLLNVDGIGLLVAERITAQRPKLNPETLLIEHEKENEAFWTPADPDYPALLFAINDPPPVLYYRGQLRLNDPNHLSVGIVGTRRPSAYGKRWTRRLSQALSDQGAIIISGLAAGIDTEAHTSCLYSGGLTVAVMGTGVDVVYPARNKSLYRQVVESGLVVSEYPDGTGPDRAHFPQRNRIIAGLSRATLVTEAPTKSGALITARLANDYCREVYALPCSLDNEQGGGCLRLIDQGAQMITGERALLEALTCLPRVDVSGGHLVESKSASRVSHLAMLDTAGLQDEVRPQGEFGLRGEVAATNAAIAPATDAPELTPQLRQVLNAVSVEPVLLDNVVADSNLETGDVLAALVQLEISGLVVQLPGMQYQRA